MNGAEATAGGKVQELIAFRIAGQEFAIDVLSIREIRGFTPATPLPQAPAFVRGVINLRGTVLPIVDLAARLGYPAAEPTSRYAIIVVEIGRQLIGLLVEGVSDIISVAGERVQPTPDVGSELSKRFLKGVVAIEGRLLSLLALEDILPITASKAA
jgi:purine-binding chemotaxis protein CheW